MSESSHVWQSLYTTLSICLVSDLLLTLAFILIAALFLFMLSAFMLLLLFATWIHGDSEFLQFFAAISLTAHSLQLHFFDVDSALAVDTRESLTALLSEATESGGYFSWADVTREVGNCHVYLLRAHHCQVQFIHLIFKEGFFQKIWKAFFLVGRARYLLYCCWNLHIERI